MSDKMQSSHKLSAHSVAGSCEQARRVWMLNCLFFGIMTFDQ